MKRLIVVLCLLFFVLGCTSKQADPAGKSYDGVVLEEGEEDDHKEDIEGDELIAPPENIHDDIKEVPGSGELGVEDVDYELKLRDDVLAKIQESDSSCGFDFDGDWYWIQCGEELMGNFEYGDWLNNIEDENFNYVGVYDLSETDGNFDLMFYSRWFKPILRVVDYKEAGNQFYDGLGNQISYDDFSVIWDDYVALLADGFLNPRNNPYGEIYAREIEAQVEYLGAFDMCRFKPDAGRYLLRCVDRDGEFLSIGMMDVDMGDQNFVSDLNDNRFAKYTQIEEGNEVEYGIYELDENLIIRVIAKDSGDQFFGSDGASIDEFDFYDMLFEHSNLVGAKMFWPLLQGQDRYYVDYGYKLAYNLVDKIITSDVSGFDEFELCEVKDEDGEYQIYCEEFDGTRRIVLRVDYDNADSQGYYLIYDEDGVVAKYRPNEAVTEFYVLDELEFELEVGNEGDYCLNGNGRFNFIDCRGIWEDYLEQIYELVTA